jgi:hypothetical protein
MPRARGERRRGWLAIGLAVGAIVGVLYVVVLKPESAPGPAAATSVTIDTTRTLTVNGTFQGYGVQDDSYMLWNPANTNLGAVVPDDYDTYVRPRLHAMRMPLVRTFIDIRYFLSNAGDYHWNTPSMRGLYTALQAHEDNGTEVMLTIWRSSPYLGGGAFPPPGTSPDYQDRWATVVTDLLRHLYGTDGSGYSFTNVRYVGAPNELEDLTVDRLQPGSVDQLARAYRLLSQKLTAAGIRQDVILFAPDFWEEGHIASARDNPALGPLIGVFDYHHYQDQDQEADDVARKDNAAALVAGTGRQVFQTEFGVRDKGGDDWLVTAKAAISAANHGLGAALLWNIMVQSYNNEGEGPLLDGGKWGLWWFKDRNYAPRVSYYLWQMITSHVVRGSDVYDNSCAEEQCGTLRVAAFRSPVGQHTIFFQNLSMTADAHITVEYAGAAPTQTLSRYLLDPAALPSSGDSVPADKTISMVNGSFTDTIPAGTFAVYSAVGAGSPPSTPSVPVLPD